MKRLKARLARLMAAITAATLIGPAVAFAGGAIVHASVDCGVGEPPWYEVSVSHKDVIDTNRTLTVTVPPAGSATRTLTHTTTLTGSITVEVGTSADASIIIAQASLEVKVQLMAMGSVTDTDTISETVNNTTSNVHDYVFFGGSRTANGRWTRYYCSVGVAKVGASGTWFSWNQQIYGALRCDQDSTILNKYGQWSVQYEAVVSCS